jgi:hypothetical protein
MQYRHSPKAETPIDQRFLSESDLPYRVDLIDWHDINDRWRQTIVAERVALTEGE